MKNNKFNITKMQFCVKREKSDIKNIAAAFFISFSNNFAIQVKQLNEYVTTKSIITYARLLKKILVSLQGSL